VRAGKILQAGRLVQGSILQQGQQLRVDAAVIEVPTTQIAGSTNDDQALDQLFTLERNIALGLFQQLGITLTTTQRNAIEQRPTRSLAAFLSYSRGLVEEDQGRYDEANRYYQNAVRIDPGFGPAQQKTEQMQSIINSQQVTTQQIEQGLRGSAEGQIVQQAIAGSVADGGGQPAAAISAAGDLNPATAGAAATAAAGSLTVTPPRDAAGAGTGLDNPASKPARIEIRVQRP
jgi:tetratricopeptide (TPR) repeat protein